MRSAPLGQGAEMRMHAFSRFSSPSAAVSCWCFRCRLVAIVGSGHRLHEPNGVDAQRPRRLHWTPPFAGRSTLQSEEESSMSLRTPETQPCWSCTSPGACTNHKPIRFCSALASLQGDLSSFSYAPTLSSDLPIRSAYTPKTQADDANPAILREWRGVLCRQPTWYLVQAQPCLAPTCAAQTKGSWGIGLGKKSRKQRI
jgi:hypothetical protein